MKVFVIQEWDHGERFVVMVVSDEEMAKKICKERYAHFYEDYEVE